MSVKVINKYHIEPGTNTSNMVYVGRPTKWGNPFLVGKDGTREEVVAKYRQWIKTQPQLLLDLIELKGKDLVCFCAPKSCHADVLLELVRGGVFYG